MSNLTFVPYELPRSSDGRYILAQEDYQVLLSRRQQLGLTQQQVADRAHILLRQYQRIESGENDLSKSTMKVGLSICAALLLDPYDFIGINDIDQPDPASIKPQQSFDTNIPEEIMEPKRVGRKPIRRNVMKVYLNSYSYNMIIPVAVLEALDKPAYIQIGTLPEKHYLVIRPVSSDTEEAMDVPEYVYDHSALAIPGFALNQQFHTELGWGPELRLADAFLVHDNEGLPAIVLDTENASLTDPIQHDFIVPECFDVEEEAEEDDDEQEED